MLDLRFSEAELAAQRDHIVDFIASTVDDAGADGAVLGLSGGVDSTTTAYLAVDALGTENVYGLILPAEVSSEENMSDAERVAETLGIDYDVVEIGGIVGSIVDAIPGAERDTLAVGNARARVRGVVNYYVANEENYLVLGTGNRAEAMTGYFTKYGDQAVDCNPIGNLYKQQVRQLAAYLGAPEDLAEKTATAGLWADQTDEQELGVDYDTIDAVVALHIAGDASTSATARELGVEERVVERVRGLYERSEHKRRMPPAPEPLSL
ncbi:NAD+ synthase [Haloarchaeobius sp. HRN-SO-5]|uniref:NAD+ synthase n=1 Tax=Haloarchaeobius sp. HRN-SO-5 TaxID=3446118 RepID=UPI003EB7BA66